MLALQKQWVAEGITHGLVDASVEEFTNRLGQFFLVAEQDAAVIGFITATEHESTGLAVIPRGQRYLEIDDVYVVPERQHQGVGGRLLDRIQQEAREKGIDRFLIYSASKDIDSILRFYRGHGFRSWYVQMYK